MKAKLIKLENCEYDLLVDTNVKNLAGTKLSIKNCLAIVRGYDLDELAIQKYPIENTGNMYMPNRHEVSSIFRQEGFKAGFQNALELMGDKKFSEYDVKILIDIIHSIYQDGFGVASDNKKQRAYELIQSVQQTEWDVMVEMEYHPTFKIPKLDADGCLILKKV